MPNQIFSYGSLPEYHKGMVILKLKPSAVARAFALSDLPDTSAVMSVLRNIERSGGIKEVTPLKEIDRDLGPVPGVGPMVSRLSIHARCLALTDGSRPQTSATCIVEVEEERQVDALLHAAYLDETVEFCNRVPVRYLCIPNSDNAVPGRAGHATALATPPSASSMWNLKKIRWQQARELSTFKEASDIKVAILDTGIQIDHPDIADRVKKYVYQYPRRSASEKDIVGHGTHVAGTVAALINNDVGINGICEAQLYCWKIFSDKVEYVAENFHSYVVDPVMYRAALADCVETGVEVVNLSIGGPGRPDREESDLFADLLANNIAVVAAMGNERMEGNPTSYPAAIDGVIAVGATNVNDRYARFSNYGNHITLSAPGAGIWSTVPTYAGQIGFVNVNGPNGPTPGRPYEREVEYAASNGTSMAAPHVTAAVALLFANKGKMNPREVKRSLKQSADKVDGMNGQNFTPDYGAGRLNLERLLTP